MSDAQLIEAMKSAALEAGRLALSLQHRLEPTRKADRTWVTRGDIEVERQVSAQLKQVFPDIPIIGEESHQTLKNKRALATGPLFVLDPIDGTQAFIQRIPTWSVSLGYMEAGRPRLGVIHMPATGDLIWCDTNTAWHNGARIQSGEAFDPEDSSTDLMVPSNYHRRLRSTFPGNLRALGSIATHLALTARGAAVAALGRVYLWDIVAGFAIIEKAGGQWAYLDGSPLDFVELAEGGKMDRHFLACQRGPEGLFHTLQGYFTPLAS